MVPKSSITDADLNDFDTSPRAVFEKCFLKFIAAEIDWCENESDADAEL
jgi:hypothetical protein